MSDSKVRQRKVFYVSGFDPRGAGHYHGLYRREAAAQAKVTGLDIAVSTRRRVERHLHQWEVTGRDQDGAVAHSTVNFLAWDDLIRENWSSGFKGAFLDLVFCLRTYVLSGLFLRYGSVVKGQLITGFYPPLFLLLSLLAAIGLGACAAALAYSWAPEVIAFPLSIVVASLSAWTAWRGASKIAKHLAVFWLLRIYAFAARWPKQGIRGLDERLDAFAKEVSAALHDPQNDEILVVAHSVGTMLSIPLLRRVLAEAGATATQGGKPRLALITLGECIPLISFQPSAFEFRRDLEAVGTDPRVHWVDFTAPTDGACFPLLDPVTSAGIRRVPGAGPKMLSPRFHKLYDPEKYKKLCRDKATMHFLYLMSSDRAGGYDYFSLTAGPLPLSAKV